MSESKRMAKLVYEDGTQLQVAIVRDPDNVDQFRLEIQRRSASGAELKCATIFDGDQLKHTAPGPAKCFCPGCEHTSVTMCLPAKLFDP
jgi:hypothetical protein